MAGMEFRSDVIEGLDLGFGGNDLSCNFIPRVFNGLFDL
jgi:hypothetical protein